MWPRGRGEKVTVYFGLLSEGGVEASDCGEGEASPVGGVRESDSQDTYLTGDSNPAQNRWAGVSFSLSD